MPFSFGGVLLVPFPFTNQQGIKKRPAVVASSVAYNRTRPDVIIMAATSQLRGSAGFGEVAIQGWRAAGLLAPSTVKPVFATLEQRLVFRSLGKLNSADQGSLRSAIAQVIG